MIRGSANTPIVEPQAMSSDSFDRDFEKEEDFIGGW